MSTGSKIISIVARVYIHWFSKSTTVYLACKFIILFRQTQILYCIYDMKKTVRFGLLKGNTFFFTWSLSKVLKKKCIWESACFFEKSHLSLTLQIYGWNVTFRYRREGAICFCQALHYFFILWHLFFFLVGSLGLLLMPKLFRRLYI